MTDDTSTPVDNGESGSAEPQSGDSTESTESTSLLGTEAGTPSESEGEDNSSLEGDEDKDKSPLDEDDVEKDGEEENSEDSEDGVPEEYEDFELPEGMPLNQEALERATPMFKELGLNQEQAQKAVTMHAELLQDMEQQNRQQLADMRDGWKKEIQGDPNHPEMLANAKQAVEHFGDDEVKDLLYSEWLGDNPVILRFLGRIGEGMNDDNFVGGAGSPGTTKELPDRMFDDMKGLPSR